MQTVQSRAHTPNQLLYRSLTFVGHCPPALVTLGQVPDDWGQSSDAMPQSLLNVFILASPKSAYFALPVSSRGSHNSPHFPCSLCLPTYLGASLCPLGVARPLLLRSVHITDCVFSGSLFLICWPHLPE